MNEFTELEYKYKADDIKLADFRKLMSSLPVQRHIEVASWDIYYTKQSEAGSFHRLRLGPTPELTKKVKTSPGNNYQRIEVDVPLDPTRITPEIISKYMELQGYRENFRIFKYCDIYVLDNINYVYYTVYGDNMQELGRFVEVEINKHKVHMAWGDTLREGEVKLEQLGITPQHRMRKSLFELFGTRT